MRSSPSTAQATLAEAGTHREPSSRRAFRGVAVAVVLVGLLSPIVHTNAAEAATATTRKSAPAKVVKSPLPVMNVTDVKTGRQVALASTFDGTKPMLIWFWAPH